MFPVMSTTSPISAMAAVTSEPICAPYLVSIIALMEAGSAKYGSTFLPTSLLKKRTFSIFIGSTIATFNVVGPSSKATAEYFLALSGLILFRISMGMAMLLMGMKGM